MKKISYLIFIFTLFSAPFFTSCEDEPLTGEFFSTPDGSEDDGTNSTVDQEACDAAREVLQLARILYATSSEEEYSKNCNNYATSIETTIMFCGDPNGNLNNALQALGDCSTPNLCLQAQVGANVARVAFENATAEEQETACFNYLLALENQIAACGDLSGDIQAIIDGLPCDNDCEDATIAAQDAQAVFNDVDVTDADAYVAACNAYKEALLTQINACGDTDGSLQAALEGLGDCEAPEQDGPVRYMVDGELKNFNTTAVSTAGSTLNVLATDVDTGDTFFFRVVFQQTGVNVVQDVSIFLGGVEYTAVLEGNPTFTSEITENSADTETNIGTIIGSFMGPVQNADGDTILLEDGIIDVRYNL